MIDRPLSPVRRAALFMLAGLLMAVVGLTALAGPEVAGASIALGIIMGPAAVWILVIALRCRLFVDDDRLVIRNVRGVVSVELAEVLQICTVRGREGLVLREAVDAQWARDLRRGVGLRVMGNSFYDDFQSEWIDQQRWVDLTPFGYWLHHGELLEHLRSRLTPESSAPLVVSDKTRPPPRRANDKVIVGVVLATVLICAAAIAGGTVADALEVTLLAGLGVATGLHGLSNVVNLRRLLTNQGKVLGIFWFVFGLMQIMLGLILVASAFS